MQKSTLRFSLLTFLLLFTGTLFAQWQQKDLGSAQLLQKMYAYNTDICFVVGSSNTLYRTNDKGLTWSLIPLTTATGILADITFLNAEDGYIANASGLILHSSDLGLTWTSLPLSGFSDGSGSSASDPTLCTGLKFQSIASSMGIIYTSLRWTDVAVPAVNHSFIYKSSDKGMTWTKSGSDMAGVTINSIEAIGQVIYIGGSSGTFRKSNDGGLTWTDYSNNTTYTSVNDLRLIDASTIILSTTKGLFKATNEGATIATLVAGKISFDALYFADLGVTFTCGAFLNDLRSINNGSSWEAANLNLGSAVSFFDLTYFNNSIYAVGSDKKMYVLSPAQLKDPVADFTATPADNIFTFTNTSLNSGSYSWDFGDGSALSTEVNPVHTYAGIGSYNVKLTSGNAVKQLFVTKSITLAQSVNFSFAIGNARQVTFTNQSQNCTGYSWDFGDGTALSSEKNPVHTYSSYGSFSAKLIASNGSTNLELIKELSFPQPTADFTFVIENANSANFTNLSQNCSTFIWDFGDGSPTSTDLNPAHIYTSAGTFTVRLTSGDGTTSVEITKQLTTSLPISDYTYVVGANKSLTFTNLCQNAASYSWDFGDGTAVSAEINPVHAFAGFGDYSVKLIATNNLGTTEITRLVAIPEAIANFSFITESGAQTVFTNTSINCITFSWDFGDGTALSADVNPTHTYTGFGEFNVKLVAGDGVNESNVSKIVTISQPLADFSFVIENGNKVTFTNLSQNSAAYSWDFGDGSTVSADANPIHSFMSYGNFNVTLTAGNSIGQVNSMKEISILQPSVDFSYTVEEGNRIIFANKSQNCQTYSWDFAGLGNSTLESPSFVIPALGSFDVVLTGKGSISDINVTKTISIDLIGVPWTTENTGVTQNLQKMQAFDNETAIIAGNGTTIIRTTNGGSSWVPASFPVANAGFNPNDLIFFDRNNGLLSYSVIGSNNGFILRTNDNGLNWSPIDLSAFSDGSGNVANDPMAVTSSKVNFFSMATTDATTGFVVVRWQENPSTPTKFHGYVYKTSDKGNTWTRISQDIFIAYSSTSVINAIAFDASGTGYIAGVNLLLKTTDGGATWTKITLSNITSFGSINDLIVKDANNVFLASQYGTIKTTDGFSTGSIVDAGFSFDIIPLEENTYLSGKDATTLKISRDNGTTWESAGKGIGSFFELAVFNNKVYALSSAGKAYISYLDFYNKPILNFSYTAEGKVATLHNLSANARSYEWSFGDGENSTELSPAHTYVNSGGYSVTLNGGNLCWKAEAKTIDIILVVTGVETKGQNSFNIWPNPATQGYVNLSPGDDFKGVATIAVTDIQGKLVYTKQIESGCQMKISLNPGMYLVRITGKNFSATKKLIVN